MEFENEEELGDDFQTPLPIVAQINNKRKKSSGVDDDVDSNIIEESACHLCKTSWSIAGPHRIVSLNCGHLFGRSCIIECLRYKKKKSKKGLCPICRKEFLSKDIWPIWPKKLLKPNPLHIKELRQELEELKKQELDQVDAIELVQADIKLHRKELSQLVSLQPLSSSFLPLPSSPASINSSPSPLSSTIQSGFIDWETIQLSSEPNASRVLAFKPSKEDIIVSTAQDGKYGLKVIKIEAPTLSEFIGNHSKSIRDLKCSTDQNMLLSTGFDKTLKLTSMTSNTVVQSYELNSLGWSCSFDPKSPNTLYSGLSNGSLLVFDIRNTKSHVKCLKPQDTNSSPIHSICIHHDPHFTSVICSSLTQCYTWNFNDASGEPGLVELHQDITDYKPFSIYSQNNTLLTCFRNNTSTKYMTNPLDLPYQVEWTFDSSHPQPVLSRNIFFEREDETIFCLTNQNKINLRNKHDQMQQLEMKGDVLDIKHQSMEDTELLACLSSHELKIFKFEEEDDDDDDDDDD